MSTAPTLTPCLFDRRLLPKPWGGRGLERFGIDLPEGELIGESWEVFDRAGESSRIRGEDRCLAELMLDPERLLGRGIAPAADGRFPLLLKWLDASSSLSVQVHPDAEMAEGRGDGPKEEAWVIADAPPDARIVRGFVDGVDDDTIRRAVASPAIESLLHSFSPRDGDVVHVPPGTVHSLGPNVVVFEVQQNSDLTFRMWDWGRDRELHVEDALASLRSTPAIPQQVQPRPVGPDEELLLEAESFTIRRLRLAEPRTIRTSQQYLLVTALRGHVALGWRSGGTQPPIHVAPADTVLVPACIDEVFLSPIGGVEILLTGPGVRS